MYGKGGIDFSRRNWIYPQCKAYMVKAEGLNSSSIVGYQEPGRTAVDYGHQDV